MGCQTFRAKPFFLKTNLGERFCLYYESNSEKILGTFIYIHPFAEEMNKSRRMIAQQSRVFMENGFSVLQIDLYGCGDSSGEFRDASWDIWKQDIFHAIDWVQHQGSVSINLWGLRLGALLALNVAIEAREPFHHIVLWNPIINGNTFLTQFLRLRVASQLKENSSNEGSGTRQLRRKIVDGETLEIAGYEISPSLALAIDKLDISKFKIPNSKIHWLEVIPEVGRTLSPAGTAIVNGWKQQDIDINLQYVPGLAFWATQEITECPELIAFTTKQFSSNAQL